MLQPPYDGFRVINDPSMVDIVEDWSRVRSPGRARRRRSRHKQNIAFVRVPKASMFISGRLGVIIGHPVTIAELMKHVKPLVSHLT
jgi:hypothetical protein